MKNSELYYLLGHCLVLGEDPEFEEKLRSIISSGEIDYEKFVYMASSHLVTPLIYRRFLDNGILDDLPQELCSYLEEIYALNLARNQRILRQTEEFTAVLNGHNIFPVLLKGAGNLADGLYKDPGDRMMIDIDFLTSGKDFIKSIELLNSMGYYTPEKYDVDLTICHHYPRLIKDGESAGVEIHRLPVSGRQSKWFNYNYVSEELMTSANYSGCRVLSDRHKLINSFIHSQFSHEGQIYGLVSMRNIYDFFLLSKRISEGGSDLPETFIRKAADYFYLVGRITGISLPWTRRKNIACSAFLVKHHFNLASKPFFRINLLAIKLYKITVRFLSYFLILCLLLFSSKTRNTVKRKLSSRKWYRRHFNSWMKLIKG